LLHDPPAEDAVVRRVIAWADAQEAVRAVLLTSTRARPDARVDRFSDYDVILVVRAVTPWLTDHAWVTAFGEVLVAYWDPVPADPDADDAPYIGSVIQYADGLKIDFTLWTVARLHQIRAAPEPWPELDAGYRVLRDKDGITAGLPAPTYRAYIPVPPSAAAFQQWVEEFFSDAPYVAKCLWRAELLPAKWALDFDMKHVYLRPVLEWWVACAQGWTVPVGVLGRGLPGRLPPDLRAALAATYVGAGLADNWAALFATLALFGRVARAVAACLGYAYPEALDARVTAFVRAMQATPRPDPSA
jgi:aminoglycoside 6-adenylyltransferase